MIHNIAKGSRAAVVICNTTDAGCALRQKSVSTEIGRDGSSKISGLTPVTGQSSPNPRGSSAGVPATITDQDQ